MDSMKIFSRTIDTMCHTIGFSPLQTRKGQSMYKATRNYFCGHDDDLEECVKDGYVGKANSSIFGEYYYLTNRGVELLSDIFKIKIRLSR